MGTDSDASLHRDMGNLQARMHAVETRQREDSAKLSQVHDVIMNAKGGYKTLLMVGGFGAAIGGGIAWLVNLIATLRGHG